MNDKLNFPGWPIKLSMVVNCYFDKKSTALVDLLKLYASYNPALLDRLHVVIVDDGSPAVTELQLPLPEELPLNLTLLRIKEDIPWNQGGARNLGVVYASSEKVLLTDLDHYFTQDALEFMLRKKVPRRVIFKMARCRNDKLTRSHPNTFLLNRSRFLELFGYDEEFSGNYGCDDEMFVYWHYMMGTRFRWLPRDYPVRLRDFSVETETHDLVRDRGRNQELLAKRKADLRERGPDACHSRRFLNFEWEVVMNSQRMIAHDPLAKGACWRLRIKVLENLRNRFSRSPYRGV